MKATMKEPSGEFITPEDLKAGLYVCEVDEIELFKGEQKYDTPSIYVYYNVYAKPTDDEPVGRIRELMSLYLSPKSKLYARWIACQMPELDFEQEIDVEDMVGHRLKALLKAVTKGDRSFLNISEVLPHEPLVSGGKEGGGGSRISDTGNTTATPDAEPEKEIAELDLSVKEINSAPLSQCKYWMETLEIHWGGGSVKKARDKLREYFGLEEQPKESIATKTLKGKRKGTR